MRASVSPWRLDLTEGTGEALGADLKRGEWSVHQDLGRCDQTLTLSVDGQRVFSVHLQDGTNFTKNDLDWLIDHFTNCDSTPLIARIAILEYQLQVAVKALAERQE